MVGEGAFTATLSGTPEFVVPLWKRRLEAAVLFTVVMAVVEIALLINLHLTTVVPLFSLVSRLTVLLLGGAIGAFLASRTYRAPRDRVLAGPASLTFSRADGFKVEIPVEEISKIEFGYVYQPSGSRTSTWGTRVTLENRSEYELPSTLHDPTTGQSFGSYLAARFPDVSKGTPTTTKPALATFALGLMVVTLAAVLLPILMGSMGHELLAIPLDTGGSSTAERFNRFDIGRGLHFTTLLPLPNGEVAVGTERQGAWRFSADGRPRRLGDVRGYVISLAVLPDDRIAVAWADDLLAHFDHVEVAVFEGGEMTDEFRLSRDLQFPTQLLWQSPCLYVASGEGLLCLTEDGELSTVIEGWCSNLRTQTDGSLIVYHSIDEHRRLLRLTPSNDVEIMLDTEHCPAEFAYDEHGRMWAFRVRGQGQIDPPDGPKLPKLPLLVKGAVATPSRVWVKMMVLETGHYGLGFWLTEDRAFHLVFDPSDSGDPAHLEYGHGILWIGGRGGFDPPALEAVSPSID